MKSNSQYPLFRFNSYFYTLRKSDSEIAVQILKGQQVEAEQSFTLEQLKCHSIYFCLFTSLQLIYDDLISLANEKQISIEEKNETYYLVLAINLKEINAIKLEVRNQSKLFLNRVKGQMTIEGINLRLDNQESALKRIDSRLGMLEELLFKQVELLHQFLEEKGGVKRKEKVKPKVNVFQINSFDFEVYHQVPIKEIKASVMQGPVPSAQSNFSPSFPTEEDKEMISKWISKDRKLKWNLLYNPVKGKDNYEECLKHCYNKPSIVVLIESDNGSKFGGYTSVGWDTPPDDYSYKIKADFNAFLCSLDKKKKYKIKSALTQSAICCLKDFCFTFNKGFGLCNDFMSSKENRIQITQYGNGEPKYEVNNGEPQFTVKQLFVYQISY